MLSLPADLDTLCYTLFEQCDEFNSSQELRALFVTTDLAPFANGVPERAGGKKSFVTAVKLFLLEKRLADGRALLLPFIETLRGRYSEHDALNGELGELYRRVLVLDPPPLPKPDPPGALPAPKSEPSAEAGSSPRPPPLTTFSGAPS